MQPTEALAAVIRGVRRARGLSQDALSGIDKSYLSRVELGRSNVTIEMLQRISSILGVQTAVLVHMASALQSGQAIDIETQRFIEQLSEFDEAGAWQRIEEVRSESKRMGRPPTPGREEKILKALQLKTAGMPVHEISEELGLSVATIRRYLKTVE